MVIVVFLGLQDEASALVQVDELRGLFASRLAERHRTFEPICLRVVRARNLKQVAQLAEERLADRPLRGGSVRPPGEERVD